MFEQKYTTFHLQVTFHFQQNYTTIHKQIGNICIFYIVCVLLA